MAGHEIRQGIDLVLTGHHHAFENTLLKAATPCSQVHQQIHWALAARGKAFRIPVRTHKTTYRLYQEEGRFCSERGRQPSSEELAAELGMNIDELARLQRTEQDAISLSQPIYGQEEELMYEDLVGDPRAKAAGQRAEDRQWLARLLEGLSERSRRILEGRFDCDLTLEEIGRRENVSRERIRQIESEALAKLRQAGGERNLFQS